KRSRDPCPQGLIITAIFCMANDLSAGSAGSFLRLIRGMIVDYDHIGKCMNALDGSSDSGLLVVRWNHNHNGLQITSSLRTQSPFLIALRTLLPITSGRSCGVHASSGQGRSTSRSLAFKIEPSARSVAARTARRCKTAVSL